MKCHFCNKENPDNTKICVFCSTPVLLAERYRIIGEIGHGGMGTVYKAIDRRLVKDVAIKEMIERFADAKERNEAIKRFNREAETLTRLEHPSLPRVTDHFMENGHFYLVMDYIEGKDLEEIFSESQLLSEDNVLNWASQICDILNYLHSQTPPIVYRDLKPSNIIKGEDGKLHLVDFGIARSINPDQTKMTSIGTVGFAAPEQYAGKAEPASDIYSLGMTIYTFLTGEIIDFRRNDKVKNTRKDLNPGTLLLIEKALQVEPENRYLSALLMKTDLEYLKTGYLRENTGILTGRVADKKTGHGLKGVTVSVGDRSAATGGNGEYLLVGASSGKQNIRTVASHYNNFSGLLEMKPGAVSILDISLKQKVNRSWILIPIALIFLLLLVYSGNVFLNRQMILDEAINTKDLTRASMAIKFGANLETVNVQGYKALHNAVDTGYEPMVVLLLDYGANINTKGEGLGRFGSITPLQIAVKNRNLPMAEFLISRGADVNAGNSLPIITAAEKNYPEMFKLLLKHGAITDLTINYGSRNIYLEELVSHNKSMRDALKKTGNSKVDNYTLFYASTDDLKRLIAKGGYDINIRDADGNTLLHSAVNEENYDKVDFLLSKGLDINARNNKGETPTRMANHYGLLKMFNKLKEKGGIP